MSIIFFGSTRDGLHQNYFALNSHLFKLRFSPREISSAAKITLKPAFYTSKLFKISLSKINKNVYSVGCYFLP